MDKILSIDLLIAVLAAKRPNGLCRSCIVETRANVHRLFPMRDLGIPKGYKIKVEILNTQIKRSTVQIYGIGENPSNGKSMLLRMQDEEIVGTYMETYR